MENPVLLQGGHFIVCLIFGSFLGAIYILFGVLRKRNRFWLSALSDILFWTICGPAVFLFLMGLNGGDVRGYLLAAVFAGGCSVAVAWYFLLKSIKKKKREKKQG